MANNQDEKITLAVLLGGVWPRSPFMATLVRKKQMTFQEFMDKGLIDLRRAKVKDTLRALTNL